VTDLVVGEPEPDVALLDLLLADAAVLAAVLAPVDQHVLVVHNHAVVEGLVQAIHVQQLLFQFTVLILCLFHGVDLGPLLHDVRQFDVTRYVFKHFHRVHPQFETLLHVALDLLLQRLQGLQHGGFQCFLVALLDLQLAQILPSWFAAEVLLALGDESVVLLDLVVEPDDESALVALFLDVVVDLNVHVLVVLDDLHGVFDLAVDCEHEDEFLVEIALVQVQNDFCTVKDVLVEFEVGLELLAEFSDFRAILEVLLPVDSEEEAEFLSELLGLQQLFIQITAFL